MMKAILKYGQFTSMIELPNLLPSVRIMKPSESVSLMPEPIDVTEVKNYGLEFRYVRRLDDDIHLYEFDREI